MSNKILKYKKSLIFILITNCTLLITNCSRRFEPDPLQLSVKQNLALLQPDPQFVMYFSFKKMRETGFWKNFISDSLFRAERNFGSFLNVLKDATGAGISGGIDELYFSNSWIGDNAIVVKGVFDRKKVDEYIAKDTVYEKLSYPGNVTVYKKTDLNLYFCFKDEFTVCASNYLKQVENTLNVTDTSKTGLLTNADAIYAIERIKYKENLWMTSNQKLFIRGIFENFADMGSKGSGKPPEKLEMDTTSDTTTTTGDEFGLQSIYKKVNAVSFSLKMTDELKFVMQNECEDEVSASELKNRFEGVLALIKLSTQFTKKKPPEIMKLFDKLKIDTFEKTVVLSIDINGSQVEELRKARIF